MDDAGESFAVRFSKECIGHKIPLNAKHQTPIVRSEALTKKFYPKLQSITHNNKDDSIGSS
jgi:hypothetical protein